LQLKFGNHSNLKSPPNKLLKHRSGQKTAFTGRANARRLAKR
jgi:hypothetical protein